MGNPREQNKREVFVAALEEAIEKLQQEKASLLARNPLVARPIDDAIQTLKNYLADCQGIPRIGILGVTGVGKSTLINHMFGTEVAGVDATSTATQTMTTYGFPPPAGDCFEVCDTRGLGEVAHSREVKLRLEQELLANRPHLLTYLVDAGRRDGIDKELAILKELSEACERKFFRRPGHLFVMTRCDTMSPSGFDKLPSLPLITENAGAESTLLAAKRKNLVHRMQWFNENLARFGFSTEQTAVPCALEWAESSRRHWNRGGLIETLHRQSSTGLLLSFSDSGQLTERLEMLAMEIVFRFSMVAAGIGAASFPISDIAIILPLQYAMLLVISAFGNKGTSSPQALFRAVGISGQGGKWVASSLLKFLPGLGNYVNSAVAGSFTCGLGYLAIQHYLHGKLPEAKYLNLFDFAELLMNMRKRNHP
ncbi:MAG: GTPase [Candidatus Ozemobacteraceae bacterium]